jgi:hypothetical protein
MIGKKVFEGLGMGDNLTYQAALSNVPGFVTLRSFGADRGGLGT